LDITNTITAAMENGRPVDIGAAALAFAADGTERATPAAKI
jgi:hypothetical protein